MNADAAHDDEITRQVRGCDAPVRPSGFDGRTVCGWRAEANGRCWLHGGLGNSGVRVRLLDGPKDGTYWVVPSNNGAPPRVYEQYRYRPQ